mmetsp:Transcript_36362/g.88816  ORF Transcript_36362/g.88816 Transcript_36362/m.88816 type:complete len:241 (+) Transcript_36362:320-1042(+)
MCVEGGSVLVSEVARHNLDPYGLDEDEAPVAKVPASEFLARTVTLFDWDDTLLASTFLAGCGLRVDDSYDLPESLEKLLRDLETLVLAVMKEALQYGLVRIITNAETGWVELSGRRFLPRVVEFIEANDIRVVSARSAYEGDFPDSPSDWKVQAFAAEMEDVFPEQDEKLECNVLVLGDSMSEREAAHAVASRFAFSRIKTVKFIERPSIEQLQRQISLVQSSFRDLWDHDGSFDVNLVC